jgi:hypothetical protein
VHNGCGNMVYGTGSGGPAREELTPAPCLAP